MFHFQLSVIVPGKEFWESTSNFIVLYQIGILTHSIWESVSNLDLSFPPWVQELSLVGNSEVQVLKYGLRLPENREF